eukprot:scaffold131417_cov19-Prasinocladus_malaysianus.AAC.2
MKCAKKVECDVLALSKAALSNKAGIPCSTGQIPLCTSSMSKRFLDSLYGTATGATLLESKC